MKTSLIFLAANALTLASAAMVQTQMRNTLGGLLIARQALTPDAGSTVSGGSGSAASGASTTSTSCTSTCAPFTDELERCQDSTDEAQIISCFCTPSARGELVACINCQLPGATPARTSMLQDSVNMIEQGCSQLGSPIQPISLDNGHVNEGISFKTGRHAMAMIALGGALCTWALF